MAEEMGYFQKIKVKLFRLCNTINKKKKLNEEMDEFNNNLFIYYKMLQKV